jgi:hypothetical protein
MAGGRAFKSNVRERREAERKMKQLLKRQRKAERRREGESGEPAAEHAHGGKDAEDDT